MNKKFLVFLAAIFISGTMAFTACSSDDGGNSPGTEQGTVVVGDADTTLIVIDHYNMQSENDVTILNADTSQIAVSKAFIDRKGYKDIERSSERCGCVWQKVSRMPFYFKIKSARLNGDKYIMDIALCDMFDAIGDIDMDFDNGLYTNGSASQRRAITRADGTVGDIVDPTKSYTDANDTVHPAAILFTDPELYEKGFVYKDTEYDAEGAENDPAHARSMLTRAGGTDDGDYPCITPDKGGNGSFDVTLVNLNGTIEKEFKFQNGDNGTDSSRYVKIKIPSRLYVGLYGSLKTKWFKPKQFSLGIKGKIGFSPTVTFGVGGSLKWPTRAIDKEIAIAELGSFTMVFWIGLPVVIAFKPELNIYPEAILEGKTEVGFNYDFANEFRLGATWKSGKGWNNDCYYKQLSSSFSFVPPQASLSAETSLMVGMAGHIKLYHAAGPKIVIGPKATLKGTVAIDPSNFEAPLSINANATMTLTGMLNLDVKIAKYKLGTWGVTLDIVPPYEIWSYKIP